MTKQKFLDPMEWRKLDSKKNLNMLTRMFFLKCSETPMFVNRKISTDYLKVRSFFRKQDESIRRLFYDYMWTIERTPMDMSTLFIKVEQYRLEQRMPKDNSQNKPEQYEPLLEALKRL